MGLPDNKTPRTVTSCKQN